MNSDIRIKTTCPDHPKVQKMMRILGDGSFWNLIKFWCNVAIYKPDGNLGCYDLEDIEMAASWRGARGEFYVAMKNLGFIKEKDGHVFVNDWAEHNPWAAGSEERSDQARFAKMKSHHPELYKMLYDQGVRRISATDYQRHVNAPLTDRPEKPLTVPLTPTPTPIPTPIPTPTTLGRFSPPSEEEVVRLFIEKGSTEKEAKRFHAFYESKGWFVGKNKMKSWPHAAAGWIARNATSKREEHDETRSRWARELLDADDGGGCDEAVVNQIQGPTT